MLVVAESDSDGYFTKLAQEYDKPLIVAKDALEIGKKLKEYVKVESKNQVLPRGVGLDFWKGKVYMFVHSGVFLFVMVESFVVFKLTNFTTVLYMFFSAIVAAFTHSLLLRLASEPRDIIPLIPIRHIVEGAFTYFDVCLIFLSATFFMALFRDSGGVAFIVRKIATAFHARRNLCLLFLTLVLLLPGAITGSGATTVLTVGALVSSVLSSMGIDETRRAGIIYMGAVMSAAAPPINLWAMMAAAGANMPYVGFAKPLLVLSLMGALFSTYWLAGKGSKN